MHEAASTYLISQVKECNGHYIMPKIFVPLHVVMISSCIFVGIRSITTEGHEQAKKFGAEGYEMRTFSRDRQFLENLKLGEGVKGVYISIDVDCLDPAYAPGVSHIEPGGLSFRDVLNIPHNLKGDIVAADVVEYNPQRDIVGGMTAMVAAKLVRELCAKMSK
ncbi:hypothetical protein RIF29_26066 [Crotalaria pallida]|uniref:Arginase n=1 Tax=Crotalaria pallida TaxID=3830 RepID=A0AAN9EMY3_CROPI